MSFFKAVTLQPEDPIFSLPIAYKADPRKLKVNLGIGSYLDDEGVPFIFPCVRTAEESILKSEKEKEYAPIGGSPAYIEAVVELVFGAQLRKELEGRIFAAQSLGGTGALRLGGDLLFQEITKTISIPDSTWSNHHAIFSRCGLIVRKYRYYDEKTRSLDFSGLCEDVKGMQAGTAILLHAGCHNPTGTDLDINQWKTLAELLKKQRVIPFFDFAYQGFGRGVEEDALAVRLFAELGFEFLTASSFSKNFGLYGERIGLLSVVCSNKTEAEHVGSQLRQLIRSSYSNPPRHGALIVKTILGSPELKKAWLEDLSNLRMRLHEMRHLLALQLMSKGDVEQWSFIEKKHGFFALLDLSDSQVEQLKRDYAIYMPSRGRVNIAGLNQHNMDYVVDSILAVTKP